MYEPLPDKIRYLRGLGPKSEASLAKVGITTVEEFMVSDPYEIYQKVSELKGTSLNFMYAIIGAQENRSWQEVAKSRKTEILLRLDDLGLAPK